MRIFLFLMSLSAAFVLSSCRKERNIIPVLPPETQTGANTFGSKVNGEIWLPKGAAFTTPAYDVQYYKSSGALLIKTNRADQDQSQNIYLYDVKQIGDYTIQFQNAFRLRHANSSCNLYDRHNSLQTGTVTITKLDTANKIVSGRFEGTLRQTDCPDITITEGRFDFEMSVFG